MMMVNSAVVMLALTAVPAALATPQRTQQATRASAVDVAAGVGSLADAYAGARRDLRFRIADSVADESVSDDSRSDRKQPSDDGKGDDSDSEDEDDVEGMVECTTHTTEIEVTIEKNADIHSGAIAKAFATACEVGSDVNMQMFEEIFMEEDAFAFAHATAVAMITCTSTDEDAYHCASVTASATAFAEATAEAHASAVATAVQSCGCMTDAVAVAVASADTYIKLIAEASATATASVCISGEGSVSAAAYDSCSSAVFGKVFARAVSEAIVKGNCLNSEAIARVLTEAGYEFDSYSTCGMTAEAIKVA